MCIKQNIGLKGCDSTEYDYYINELFPITNANIADLADEESVTAAILFNKMKDKAWLDFLTDIEKRLKKYTFHGISDTINIGLPFSDETLASNTNERGVKVELRNKCKDSSFYLTSIDVESTTDYIVYVDGVDVTENVELPYKIEGKEIKIVSVGDVGDYTNYCCETKESCNCVSNKYMRVYGIDGTETTDKTYGVCATIEARCSLDDFICRFSNERVFNYAFAKRVYIELLELCQKRKDYSPFVVNSQEFVTDELSKYLHGYVIGEKPVDGDYISDIKLLVTRIEKAIEKGNCKCCFNNNQPYSKTY